jgi:hypothetical protein
MSILKSKHSGWTWEGRRTPFTGGGGGGGQPTQTTNVNTNVPEYARPYVENMLEAGQRQLFQTDGNTITGFREYQPYSTDPTKYFAGPSSLQTSSYNEAAGMQTPGGYAPAQMTAAMSGLGGLAAGTNYQRMATNPFAVQSYMSPYQQSVTDVEKASAIRDYEKAMPTLAAQAVRQGAFGGSRSAIERSEAQRALGSRLGEIQARGTQSAYDKAMQNMQFGSTLGLQGLGQATSAASALGQLSGAEQQSDIARLGLQNQLGQQQQQYQQGIINQAIQDYATQQQYPIMQLGVMSNLLRGLPMQSSSTQMYQAQPSGSQQALGLGLGALGAYKAFS